MAKTKVKFDCYSCKHCGEVPGSCHKRCNHPSIPKADPLTEVMAIFASVRRVPPVIGIVEELNIKGDPHGISHGWFNWPFNFDPVWLVNCDGYEPKDSAHA